VRIVARKFLLIHAFRYPRRRPLLESRKKGEKRSSRIPGAATVPYSASLGMCFKPKAKGRRRGGGRSAKKGRSDHKLQADIVSDREEKQGGKEEEKKNGTVRPCRF